MDLFNRSSDSSLIFDYDVKPFRVDKGGVVVELYPQDSKRQIHNLDLARNCASCDLHADGGCTSMQDLDLAPYAIAFFLLRNISQLSDRENFIHFRRKLDTMSCQNNNTRDAILGNIRRSMRA